MKNIHHSFSSDPGVWFACLSPSQEQIIQQRILEPMSWDELNQYSLLNRYRSMSDAVSTCSSEDIDRRQHHHQIENENEDDNVTFGDDIVRSVDQLLEGEELDDINSSIQFEMDLNNNVSINKEHKRRVRCKFFQKGTCKAGDKCRFAHEIDIPSTPPALMVPRRTLSTSSVGSNGVTRYCKFYEQGNCKNSNCTFMHDPSRVGSNFDNLSALSSVPSPTNLLNTSYYMDHSMHYSPQDYTVHYMDSPSTSPVVFHMNHSFSSSDGGNTVSSDEETKVCPFYLKGECRYGDRCRNLHVRSNMNKKKMDLQSLERMRRIPCKYHRQGVCPFGNTCYFNHEMVDEENKQSIIDSRGKTSSS
jgi:hypothetical protein